MACATNTVLVFFSLAFCTSPTPVDIAREYGRAGKIAEAYDILETAIMEATDSGSERRAISCMIELTVTAPDHVAAMNHFISRAREISPLLEGENKAYLLFHIGKRYCLLREYKQSSDFLKAALPKVPECEWKWHMEYQLAYNLYLQQSFAEAAAGFEKLKASDLNRLGRPLTLGLQLTSTYFQLKEWPKLIDLATETLEHAGDEERKLLLLDLLGRAYREVDDDISAMHIYEEYLTLHEQLHPGPSAKRAYIRQQYEKLKAQWDAILAEHIESSAILDHNFPTVDPCTPQDADKKRCPNQPQGPNSAPAPARADAPPASTPFFKTAKAPMLVILALAAISLVCVFAFKSFKSLHKAEPPK